MPRPHDPDQVRTALEETPTRALMAGEWIDTGAEHEVEDPASGRPFATVADANSDHYRAALDAAVDHQGAFGSLPPRERATILHRTYELMMRDQERLALLITLEMGKPLAESRAEVVYAAEFFRWFAEEAARIGGDYRPAPGGSGRVLVTRRPVGPSLLITPWNFPLAMGARKLAPAVAAGCTSVLKPAEATPLSSLAMAALLIEAGLPAGALSVLPTSAAGPSTAPVIADERLRKLSFTGSTAVGRQLLRAASENILRTSMELGGNAPFIVFADADLEAAVDGAMAAKIRNGGEACTAANRFLVQRSIAEEFTSRLAERMSELRLGHGTAPEVDLGPLITSEARNRVRGRVDDAVSAGAELVTGGTVPDHEGWFMDPTVVVGAPRSGDLMNEEIFGPVATIVTFEDEDEAVASANDTPAGLVAYAYTSDLNRALRLPETLEVGMVGINRGVISEPSAPFGGRKASGLGREGGSTGIDEYLETVYVALPG